VELELPKLDTPVLLERFEQNPFQIFPGTL
jgi:hypothetical protein